MKSTLAVVFSVMLLISTGCNPHITRSTAEDASRKKLIDYAHSEGLTIEQFKLIEITSAESHPWMFYYESNTSPKHLVSIDVTKSGNIEIHRMIENGNQSH